MNEESNSTEIEPELEARIVALVQGEASDLERDQLNRLLEERPELAKLKEQFQDVHELMLDVGAGELIGDDEDWQLSAEKRDSILAVISGEAKVSPAKQAYVQPVEKQSTANETPLGVNWARIAACFCVIGFLGSLLLLLPSVQMAREASSRLELAKSHRDLADSNSMPASEAALAAAEARLRAEALHSTVDELNFARNSTTSLSAIRDNLGAELTQEAEGRESGAMEQQNGGAAFGVWGAKPAEPALNVPDSGAVLLGGVNRFGEGRSKSGSSREQSELSQITDEQVGQGIAREKWQASAGEPASSRDLATLSFGSRVDEGQVSAPNESALSGGTTLRFPVDPNDSPAARQSLTRGDSNASGNASRQFGRSGSVPADAPSSSVVSGSGESAANSDFGTWFDAPMEPPAAPRPQSASLADSGGTEGGMAGGGYGGGSGRGGSANGNQALDAPFQDFSYSPSPDSSVPNPAGGAMAAGVEFEELGELPAIISDQEGLAGKSASVAGVEDLSLLESPSLGRGSQAVEKVVRPPLRGLSAGQAPQDTGWRYQAQANIAKGQTLVPDASFGEAVDKENTENAYADTDGDGVTDLKSRLLTQNDETVKLLHERGGVASDALGRREARQPILENNTLKQAGPVRKIAVPTGLNETNAENVPFSTFSLHVSDVSFKLAQAALARGEWPEAAKVRIEEFVNAFDYGDPLPNQSEKVACQVEQCVHPFLQQRNLLRVSMRTAAAGRASDTPLRLTLLLDNSGSMERSDRRQTVRRAFSLLTQQLKPIDQVTLISFARQPRLLADQVGGAQSQQLVELIDNLPSEGGTNIEAALQLALEKALEQQVDGAQNRVILLTDGAVNLGDAKPESLSKMITIMRNAGIAFDAAGISAEGLNDEILEALTREGDGRYYLLDSMDAADDGFARQIAGALRPSAKNVKVQIEFNPKRVGHYKLLGFEKHLLKQEDFRNDSVDAAEMAAAEAGVAVYQFEAIPDGEGDVGSVSVRFRDLSTGQMIEDRWPIPYEADAPRADQAAPSLRIATCAALLAVKLRGEPLGETVDLKTLSELTSGLPDRDRNVRRVQQLQQMIEQARQMIGN